MVKRCFCAFSIIELSSAYLYCSLIVIVYLLACTCQLIYGKLHSNLVRVERKHVDIIISIGRVNERDSLVNASKVHQMWYIRDCKLWMCITTTSRKICNMYVTIRMTFFSVEIVWFCGFRLILSLLLEYRMKSGGWFWHCPPQCQQFIFSSLLM